MDKTETNDLLEECMLYFKARPVYKKLFLKMRDKYVGLGHFGGTAMLTSLSREEKSQLGGFFQRDYTSNKTITISADLMKKCLESSKFAGLTWELILETYFGEPLQVKRKSNWQSRKGEKIILRRYWKVFRMKADENGCAAYWRKRKRDICLLRSYTKKARRN